MHKSHLHLPFCVSYQHGFEIWILLFRLCWFLVNFIDNIRWEAAQPHRSNVQHNGSWHPRKPPAPIKHRKRIGIGVYSSRFPRQDHSQLAAACLSQGLAKSSQPIRFILALSVYFQKISIYLGMNSTIAGTTMNTKYCWRQLCIVV